MTARLPTKHPTSQRSTSQRIEHQDVEGLRVGRILTQLTSSCILYRVGATVIDTGPPNQWRTVRRFLQERDVTRVVVTHHHEDHSGNLARAHQDLGAPVFSPPAAVAPIAAGFNLKPYQWAIWGKPRRVESQPIPDQIDLGNGRRLQAISAPGHSHDMTCYLEPDRGFLFTGDLYIASKTRYLRSDEDIRQQIISLRRILTLDFETVFCSHRGVLESGRDALGKKLDFLVELCERVHHLRNEGRDIPEITRMLVGREGLMTLLTGFHFSKRNLIASCYNAVLPQQAVAKVRPR